MEHASLTHPQTRVSILTAGKDPHYALSLLEGLHGKPVEIEFVGNDEMGQAAAVRAANVQFFNLRGDQAPNVPVWRKAARLVAYYASLIGYAGRTRARVFHILWFNRFEW